MTKRIPKSKKRKRNKSKQITRKKQHQPNNKSLRSTEYEFSQAFEIGVRFLAAQDWQLASVSLKKALDIRPADPSALANLAIATMRMGNLQEAAVLAGQAITYSDSVTDVYLGCSMPLMDAGNFSAAREALDTYIKKMPYSRMAYALKAELARREGNDDDVIACATKANTLDGIYDPNLYVMTGEAYLHKNELDNALSEFELVIEKAGTPFPVVVGENPIVTCWKGKATIHFSRAQETHNLRELAFARDAYTAAVALDPENINALGGLAATSAVLHRFGDALEAADAALAIEHVPAIALERARALSNLNHGLEAEKILDQLMDDGDENILQGVLRERPLNYLRLHRFDDSLAACETAERAGFSGPIIANARAAALFGMEHQEEALDAIRDAAKKFPDDVVLKANVAHFEYISGNEELALNMLTEVLDDDPRYPEFWALKHNILINRGDETGARAVAAAAQNYFRDNPDRLSELESALRRDLTSALFDLHASIADSKSPLGTMGPRRRLEQETDMSNDNSKFDVLFITVLPVEYKSVLTHLREVKERIHPEGTIYETGLLRTERGSLRAAVAQVGAGNEVAARETERAISFLHPSAAVFVGVAGGLKDVNIGDVVVAEKVYGFESGKAEDEFKPRDSQYRPTYPALQRARHEANRTEWRGALQSGSPEQNVYIGAIAAGDKVVASKKSWVARLLRDLYSDALAVEMEARGFLAGAYAFRSVESLVVRGISDLIDGKSEADESGSQEIAAVNASAFAVHVVKRLVENLVQDEKEPPPKTSGANALDATCDCRVIDSLTACIDSAWIQDWGSFIPSFLDETINTFKRLSLKHEFAKPLHQRT